MPNINCLQNSFHVPPIYHRRYDLDFPECESKWKEQAKRVALTVLPFISLYRPAGSLLSLGMGSIKTFSHLWGAKESSNWKNCSIEMLHGALSAFSIASSFFNFPLGLAISTAFEVVQGAYNIYAYSDNPQKMIEEILQTLSSVLYLAFIASGGVEIMLAFSLLQAVACFFEAKGEICEGRYIEAAGKIAFGCIRLGQAKEIQKQLQQRKIFLRAINSLDPNEKTNGVNPVLFSDEKGELKKEFMQSIDDAKKSILCMTFTFSDQELLNLLLKKQKEGVSITLILDKNHMQSISPYASQFKLLTRASGEGRVHQKITVIDESTIWIGSANCSPEALTKQNNTMIRLKSAQMAKALHEEMQAFAGLHDRSPTPLSPFNIEGQNVELLLFPHVPFEAKNSPEKAMNEYGRKRILDLINQAQTSIKIAVCVWTDDTILDAVIKAKKRGVDVEVIFWKQAESLANYSSLKSAGVSVQEKPKLPLMHNKWMLVDNTTFFNGSANWSKSWFSRNDEAAVILNNLNSVQKDAIQNYWNKLSNS